MVAALALMESPAIVVGIILVKRFAPKPEFESKSSPEDQYQYSSAATLSVGASTSQKVKIEQEQSDFSWGEVLREAFLNASVFC